MKMNTADIVALLLIIAVAIAIIVYMVTYIKIVIKRHKNNKNINK